jgi:hypothetical protein
MRDDLNPRSLEDLIFRRIVCHIRAAILAFFVALCRSHERQFTPAT